MAAIGFGRYAAPEFDLGVQEDVRIPRSIRPLDVAFRPVQQGTIEATVQPPAAGDLRIIFQQWYADGTVARSWPGGPPNGTSMGKVLRISAEQGGKPLPIEIDYDRLIWSGLSWGAGEIRHASFAPGEPIVIRCTSQEKIPVRLEGKLYAVRY